MNAIVAMVGHIPAGSPIGFSPIAPLSGFSFRVEKFNQMAHKAFLMSIFTVQSSGDYIRFLSAQSLHDAVHGITLMPIDSSYDLLSKGFKQYVKSDDLLLVQSQRTFGIGVTVGINIFYENLPDTHTRYISASQFKRRFVNLKTVSVSTPPFINTAFTQPQALNDLTFKPDKTYAVVGYSTLYFGSILRLRSASTNGFSVLFPSNAVNTFNANPFNYFPQMSDVYGNIDCIPTFKGIEIDSLVIDGIGVTQSYGSIIFAELD